MSDYKDRVMINDDVIDCLEYLQDEETVTYYEIILDTCIEAAIEQLDLFDDDTALDIIRGLHNLRKDLRRLYPGDAAAR